MGNAAAVAYTGVDDNDGTIRAEINTGQWRNAVGDEARASSWIDVRLDEELYTDTAADPVKYVVKFDHAAWPLDEHCTVLFPACPDPRRDGVLHTRDYRHSMAALTAAVNARLESSDRTHGPVMVVAMGAHYYRFYGVTGRVYITWAGNVNACAGADTHNEILGGAPVVFMMVATMEMRRFVVLPGCSGARFVNEHSVPRTLSHINVETSLELYYDICEFPFTRERDTRATTSNRHVHTVSENEATNAVMALMSAHAAEATRRAQSIPSCDDEDSGIAVMADDGDVVLEIRKIYAEARTSTNNTHPP